MRRPLNEELKKLLDIQDLDTEILAKKRESELIPKRVEETSRILDEAKQKLQTFEAKMEVLKRKQRDHEARLAEHAERKRKLEERVPSLKTNEEYQAHLKEMDKHGEITGAIEEQILAVMEERDQFAGERVPIEAEMSEATVRLEEARRILENEGKILEEEIGRLRETRAQLAASIPVDLYRKYMELMRQHNGRAVVAAVNEICQGCHLNMPPQHFNNLKANDTIAYCPACNRILFYQED